MMIITISHTASPENKLRIYLFCFRAWRTKLPGAKKKYYFLIVWSNDHVSFTYDIHDTYTI